MTLLARARKPRAIPYKATLQTMANGFLHWPQILHPRSLPRERINQQRDREAKMPGKK